MSTTAWGGGFESLHRQGLEDMLRRERDMKFRTRRRRVPRARRADAQQAAVPVDPTPPPAA